MTPAEVSLLSMCVCSSSRFLCFFFGFFFPQMQRLNVSKSSLCQSLRVEHSLSVTARKLQSAGQETIAGRGAKGL